MIFELKYHCLERDSQVSKQVCTVAKSNENHGALVGVARKNSCSMPSDTALMPEMIGFLVHENRKAPAFSVCRDA